MTEPKPIYEVPGRVMDRVARVNGKPAANVVVVDVDTAVDLGEWLFILAQIAGHDMALARNLRGVCVWLSRMLELEASGELPGTAVAVLDGMRMWFEMREVVLERSFEQWMKGGSSE